MRALFKEKNNEVGGAIINLNIYNNRKSISICTYNEKGFQTGRMNVIQIHINEYYIVDIYCYSKYRGRGIASSMMKMVETLIEPNSIITGTFVPYQDRRDRYGNQDYNKLFSDVRDFYILNGFEFFNAKGTIKFKKRVTFKEDDFTIIDDTLYDTTLSSDLDISEITKKIIKR